jgi:hypothetical protein
MAVFQFGTALGADRKGPLDISETKGKLRVRHRSGPPTLRELLRALRYPDRSVVIDLSRLPHDEKLRYIRAVLPALNVLRRRTGLPHRILLDEAHYYLTAIRVMSSA